jgi:hypothetical protein
MLDADDLEASVGQPELQNGSLALARAKPASDGRCETFQGDSSGRRHVTNEVSGCYLRIQAGASILLEKNLIEHIAPADDN